MSKKDSTMKLTVTPWFEKKSQYRFPADIQTTLYEVEQTLADIDDILEEAGMDGLGY